MNAPLATDATPVPPISALSAALVPHHEWAARRWFYANPIWYYHRQSTDHEVRTGRRFYELVDPQLREVCQLLNDAGLRTTPSCQGHSYPRDRFERIWDELNKEARQITADGLVVRDCENSTPYLFQQPDWQLPWPSFDAFFQQAAAHQEEGYLGIIVPTHLAALESRFRHHPYETRAATLAPESYPPSMLGGAVFGLRVKACHDAPRAAEWQRFTDYVRTLLAEHPDARLSSNPTESPHLTESATA